MTPASPPPARSTPWDAPDLFPPKPEDSEYGWRSHGRSHPCTRDELIAQCRTAAEGKQFVELVWTPDSPRYVPPAEVPWLIEPLRERARDDLRHNLRVDAYVLALGVAYIWYTAYFRQDTVPPIYLAIFLLFAIVPAAQDVWALSRLRRSFSYLTEQANALRYGVWLGGRRIIATYFVAGALAVVWAAQLVVDIYRPVDVRRLPSIEAAGLVKEAVKGGEWWRLLTAELLHGHWFHVGLNVLSLVAVGRLVEVHGSPVYLPIVFVFSAVFASLTSLFLSPGTDSVGASGAIMGLIGFLAVMGYRRRQALPRGFMKSISLSIALTAGAGLVAHQVVDNAAHLGGLIGGALLGFVYVGRRGEGFRLSPSMPARIAGWISAVLLGAMTLITIWLILQARLQGVTG